MKKALKIVLMSIIILNLFDGVFTTYWIESEKAVEANPLMADLVANTVVFMGTKLALVSLGIGLLWRLSKHRPKAILVFSSILSVIFVGIFAYHLYGFFYIQKMEAQVRYNRVIELKHHYNGKCWLKQRNFSLAHE